MGPAGEVRWRTFPAGPVQVKDLSKERPTASEEDTGSAWTRGRGFYICPSPLVASSLHFSYLSKKNKKKKQNYFVSLFKKWTNQNRAKDEKKRKRGQVIYGNNITWPPFWKWKENFFFSNFHQRKEGLQGLKWRWLCRFPTWCRK